MNAELHTDHPFVGLSATATTSDGNTIHGEIAGIWTIDGTPQQIDIDHDGSDLPLPISRDRVEVER